MTISSGWLSNGTDPARSPRREVVQAEALGWLESHSVEPGTSVITSLPDMSELPDLGFDGWRGWFVDAARRVIRWALPEGVAIFFQSDVRRAGVWVDKSFLVSRAAEDEGAVLVWHKIVCRAPPGSVSHGRATYSHMLCFSSPSRATPGRPSPDVLADAGIMSWSKAMGVDACRLACRYLVDETATRLVVDPFCGRGTVLAVANAFGLDALGIDVAARRCRAAKKLTVNLEGGS